LIVTYTDPDYYADQLSEQVESELSLPLFPPPDFTPSELRNLRCVVGVGYQLLALPELLKNLRPSEGSIIPLFPYPGAPSGIERNWKILKENLIDELSGHVGKEKLVNPKDVPEILQQIEIVSENGLYPIFLAPYGPKPMSLAMCIYACKYPENTRVIYTQPTVYNPQYSTGIKETYAYPLRLNGKNLF